MTQTGDDSALTVAVTGPTGEIGRAYIRALEASDKVERVVGMARREFDPADEGWTKTEYRQGDVLDRESVDRLVADADVVVHLAFIIVGSIEESHAINMQGSRNVFEAAAESGARRLVYASSIAAYGYGGELPDPITEDVPARGHEGHYYSRDKAEVEELLTEVTDGAALEVYRFRPCIVAGREATLLIRNLPYVQIAGRLPDPVVGLLRSMPILKPVLPDSGIPFQLVHTDDVATALVAGTEGRGSGGAYNLVAPGTLTMGDVAEAMGWYAIPIPELSVGATAEVVNRVPGMPAQLEWLHALRRSLVADSTRAREELGWSPEHDAHDTLVETVAGARDEQSLGAEARA